MTPREKLEEAHGLWELEIARLAALAEAGAKPAALAAASKRERDAFEFWSKTAREAIQSKETA